jgi:hypothetical protein
MDLKGADTTLKRVLPTLRVVVLAALVILVAVEFWRAPSPSPDARAIELAEVDVRFVGSGAPNATATEACGYRGTNSDVGDALYSSFEVRLPYESECAPHTWAVTQVAGSSPGGFAISSISAVAVDPSSRLPVTVPQYDGGESFSAASIGYHLVVINSGPSVKPAT